MFMMILYYLLITGADAAYGDRQEGDLAIPSIHVRRHGLSISFSDCCAAGSDQTTQADDSAACSSGFASAAGIASRLTINASLAAINANRPRNLIETVN